VTALVAAILYLALFVPSWWAILLPLVPWITALILILISPEGVEVGHRGAAILWSFVFAFLTSLVAAGIFSARRQ
jgi:hypothetical protein